MNIRIQQSQANQIHVLAAINKFGYLSAKHIAFYVWQSEDTTMARRALKMLQNLSETAQAQFNGVNLYALSPKGAKRLRDNGIAGKATQALLNNLGNYQHRQLCNIAVFVHAMAPENKLFSEHQIQAGNHDLINDYNKMPDYLVDTPSGCIWGEVENSKRSSKDWTHLLNWLTLITACREGENPNIGKNLYLEKIEFICEARFEKMLREAKGDQFCDLWISFLPRSKYLKYI
jgi:hypothetical protein